MGDIPAVPKSRPAIPRVTPTDGRNDTQAFDTQWTSARPGYFGNAGMPTPTSYMTPYSHSNRGFTNASNFTYQGMSPPPTPTWYVQSTQPGFASNVSTRSRSVTPNIGTNARPQDVTPHMGKSDATTNETSKPNTAPAIYTELKCRIAAMGTAACGFTRRMSAYRNAQKLWGRLDSNIPAVAGDPTIGYGELAIEIAIRGRQHVLEGIGRGSRTAFKNWRETIENAKRQGGASAQSLWGDMDVQSQTIEGEQKNEAGGAPYRTMVGSW